ncbi:DNA-deoxyinosine glycosylase [uncultured Croceicoccus sp.]|uniref:DNA-deoxyinosine glycosylase n=1 Tax=uncultured Croceicoccus sp. TaxID=1295329 RepID=UPI00263744FF|nr:DNA-deoxyinosine glycosylase [uncultured Croceicoccus sp.]
MAAGTKENGPRKSSFAAVTTPETRVLLLGSLPGEASLRAQRYYAHPRNQFWHLVGGAIGVDLDALPYAARLSVLGMAGIGLWDVARTARRSGSLDSAMRDVEGNALAALAASLPALRLIGFNGGTAARIGRRMLPANAPALLTLPSSSPAYCRVTRDEKAREWNAIRDYLRPECLQSARIAADRAAYRHVTPDTGKDEE